MIELPIIVRSFVEDAIRMKTNFGSLGLPPCSRFVRLRHGDLWCQHFPVNANGCHTAVLPLPLTQPFWETSNCPIIRPS